MNNSLIIYYLCAGPKIMKVNSLPRKPVFSYTKISTNPPFTTVAEQCFWGHLAPQNPKNFDGKTQNSRPKSSYYPSTSLTGKEFDICSNQLTKPQRPKSSQCILQPDDICVRGEKYIQHVESAERHEPVQERVDSQRCPTPDYMRSIYDDYSENLLQNLLLRRPILDQKENQLNNIDDGILAKSSDSNTSEVSLAPLCKTQHNSNTHNHAVDKSEPSGVQLPNKVENVLQKNKVAIDITLCDSSGCIIGMDQAISALPYFEDLDEVRPTTCQHSTTMQSLSAVNLSTESSPRPKTCAKSKRRIAARQFRRKKSIALQKRKVLEVPSVAVDYSQPSTLENKAASLPPENNKKTNRKADDEIVTQMASLGLAKPLADDDLHLLMQKKCPPLFQCKRKPKVNLNKESNNAGNDGCSTIRSRRIPIQIISDPFKCVGDRSTEKVQRDFPNQSVVIGSMTIKPIGGKRPQSSKSLVAIGQRRKECSVNKNESILNVSKTSDNFTNNDVGTIRDELRKAAMRITGKNLQKSIKLPTEKIDFTGRTVYLRSVASLSPLYHPKRCFEE